MVAASAVAGGCRCSFDIVGAASALLARKDTVHPLLCTQSVCAHAGGGPVVVLDSGPQTARQPTLQLPVTRLENCSAVQLVLGVGVAACSVACSWRTPWWVAWFAAAAAPLWPVLCCCILTVLLRGKARWGC